MPSQQVPFNYLDDIGVMSQGRSFSRTGLCRCYREHSNRFNGSSHIHRSIYTSEKATRPVTTARAGKLDEWSMQSRAIMSQPRASLWATEEIDEDLQVDVHLAIGNYGQNGLYDDGSYIRSVILSLSHHSLAVQLNQESMKLPSLPCSTRWRSKQRLHRSLMRSSECVLHHGTKRKKPPLTIIHFFAQFIVHFHQAVLENNLAEITVAYESGWNRLTEKHYSKTEWPEAEVIAPLVNDGLSRASPLMWPCHVYRCTQTSYSLSYTASYTTDTCTLVYNPTSMTAFTPTRIAANSSIIS
jgi:hypothetical protein